MIEGENLALTFTVPGYDITQCDVVLILEGNGKRIAKENADMTLAGDESGTVLTLRVTQKDTLALGVGNVTAQVNWIDEQGLRRATQKAGFIIGDNLYRRVMAYGGNE